MIDNVRMLEPRFLVENEEFCLRGDCKGAADNAWIFANSRMRISPELAPLWQLFAASATRLLSET